MTTRSGRSIRTALGWGSMAALLISGGCHPRSGGGGAGGGGGSPGSAGTGAHGSSGSTGAGGAGGSTGSAGAAGGDASASTTSATGSGGATGPSSSTGSGGSGGGPTGSGVYDSCGLCGPGQLLMNGLCTQVAGEPAFGCDAAIITACKAAPGRQAPHFNGSACEDGACLPGRMDCNGMANDGCEASMLDAKTCGSCAVQCAPGQVCTAGGCAAACGPLEVKTPGGGCVDPTKCDPAKCPAPVHGAPTCAGNACAITCDPGFSPCNGACADTQDDPLHCGAGCGACPAPPDGGAMACVNGACQASCPQGLTLCGTTCADLATDLDHCGQCGKPCAAGLCLNGQCDPNLPRILVSPADFTALEVDATTVFYADKSMIGRVEKTGGATQTLASGENGIPGIAVDDNHVYWSSAASNNIMRVPKAGGAAELVSPASTPRTIAVDATDVFWINDANQSMLKAPKQGGGPITTLGQTPATGGAVIKLDGPYAYWVAPIFGGVARAPRDASSPQVGLIAPPGRHPAFDSSFFYEQSDIDGYIHRQPKDFASPGTGVIPLPCCDTPMVVGKRYAYVQEYPFNSYKVLKCGGAPPVPPFPGPPPPMPPEPGNPYGSVMALDDTFIYTVKNGKLLRLPQ